MLYHEVEIIGTDGKPLLVEATIPPITVVLERFAARKKIADFGALVY